jgi:CubicO group peptidase (beta-lactamase class C family)
MLRQMLAFVTIGCLCTSAWATGSDALDAYIQHEMEAQKIPGVAFAVIDHGKIVEERAYGLENLETGTSLRTDGVV